MPSPEDAPKNSHHLSPHPTTPRKTSPSNKENKHADDAADPATPTKESPNAARARANSKKVEPTLLSDFLLGRQTPARVAADRKRRQSLEAVKAEMREEMKQDAVRKLQPPGGVKYRVQAWQRANAAVIADGADGADCAATEPSDVAFNDEDVESVTEEDRVRIKMRMKRRTAPPRSRPPPALHPSETNSSNPSDVTADGASGQSPPKKRVVSDDHWVKGKVRKAPIRRVSPRMKKSTSPDRLPPDFVIRSGAAGSVPNKVRAWAEKVEVPDGRPPRGYRLTKSRDGTPSRSGNGSDVQSDLDSSSQATARQSVKLRPKSMGDDGIRVKPIRKKKLDDDGIRVSPVASTTTDPDDGIRVRPGGMISSSNLPKDRSTSKDARYESRSRQSLDRARLQSRSAVTSDLSSAVSRGSAKSDGRYSEGPEDQDSLLDTPTKRKVSKTKPTATKTRSKSLHGGTSKVSDGTSLLSEKLSALSSSYDPGSDLSSSIAGKSIADIPGDIPFGHSAFSELDLALNKSRPKRINVDRNKSLKSVPNVFKKVVEEGKKIIQDMNEPPKQPTMNKPPSIEKWLNNTVDPFVDEPVQKASVQNEPSPTPENTKLAKSSEKLKDIQEPVDVKDPSSSNEDQPEIKGKSSAANGTEPTTTVSKETSQSPRSNETKQSSPSGLKRTRATRSSSSPLKQSGRRQFLGALKEAFQGESTGHSKPILKSYQSQEERKYSEEFGGHDHYAPSFTEPSEITDITESSVTADQSDHHDSIPRMAGPRFRPPTKGHELSTIVSEDDSSAVDSDLSSGLSHSTLTQSTALTKESDSSKMERKGSGLKRRLTRHSDLVSMLSLPEDSNKPRRMQSKRSRPSQRRARRPSSDVTADDLMREFADDEDLYLKELKTLVNGVIPVLLSQVINASSNKAELLHPNDASRKSEGVSKSVVSMGVALEKLNNAHKKAPAADLRKLSHWAHGAVPIYHNYLKVWRLGFDDLVINLAPRGDNPDDDDSLLNALPRNESGDVVNADGEKVAVAYLLKRPLVRIKQMVKLIKCIDSMMPSADTHDLLRDFEDLQDKSRRRYKEETARMTDEDAINTDISRCRELRTLKAINSVTIDPSRQVSAKDVFSLNLTHSNGQRLECQVELVHRDDQASQDDAGDLLIRESGDSQRTYLLFPPISMSDISARTGEGNFDMVVMLRGVYHGKQWHELLTLCADDEDQILDWLDILPLSPVPPMEPEPSEVGSPDEEIASPRRWLDAPVGARNPQLQAPTSPLADAQSPRSPGAISRRPVPPQHTPDSPTTPTRTSSPLVDREITPTQDDYRRRSAGERGMPLRENMRPDPLDFQTQDGTEPYREDGAPPPPAHKELRTSLQSADKPESSLTPPVDLKSSDRIRRRNSSPLKHEYLPSDVSSSSETFSTDESDSGSESSDDEIDGLDIPETELGFSIKKSVPKTIEEEEDEEEESTITPPVDALLSHSDCSLAPSNSASQAGLHGRKIASEANAARFMASISRWSDKGMWKDVYATPCSILITAGLIEAYPFRTVSAQNANPNERPIIALDLTPLVLIRQSTALDLEIRSSVQPHSRLHESHSGGNFRFRCNSAPECFNLYMSVHHSRLQNQKFIQLENEARFKSFGERGAAGGDNDDGSGRKRRSWFGRKNSYRGSVRAPAQSQDGASSTPSSNPSASSFLKRLSGGGNTSFNIARSSIDRNSLRSGGNSLYTSGSSSASGTPPRSPSVSVENSGHIPTSLDTENIRIRLHLLVTSTKWEDYGNCVLQIRRPPPGWHQALRANHGLEKRITVTTMPRKDGDVARIMLDAVLGSGCFTSMGSRGIVCGVWEEVKDGNGAVGVVPATGATGGNIKKWCFQCATAGEANWVLRLVLQEVLRA